MSIHQLYRPGPFAAVVGLALSLLAVTPAATPSSAPTPLVKIPKGTRLEAAIRLPVSTERNKAGDRIEVRTVKPVRVDDNTVLPVGVRLIGEITQSRASSIVSRRPELTVRFYRLHAGRRFYPIAADPVHVSGKPGDQIEWPIGHEIRVRLAVPAMVRGA